MKIVKLNNRFKIHQLQGFELALRFDSYGPEAREYEKIVNTVCGKECWLWKWQRGQTGDWATGWSNATKSGESRPYWIYLRKESLLSAVLLLKDH